MQTPNRSGIAVALLGLLGVALCGWLLLRTGNEGAIIPCPMGGGCDRVTTSAYAWIGPFRVAEIGMAGYAAVTLFATAALWRQSLHLWRALTLVTTAGFLFTLYLQTVSLGVLRSVCFWCLLSAGIMTLTWGISMFPLRQ